MAAIHFDSQSVKKQAKLLEEAADQIQNQTLKVITAANEAVAASWSGKAAEIFVKFMQEQNTDLASGAASLRAAVSYTHLFPASSLQTDESPCNRPVLHTLLETVP